MQSIQGHTSHKQHNNNEKIVLLLLEIKQNWKETTIPVQDAVLHNSNRYYGTFSLSYKQNAIGNIMLFVCFI